MNYLGLDWGKSKIGVAIGSDETKMASPILILSYKSVVQMKDELSKLIKSENVDKIVVGKPVSLSGGSDVSEAYQAFITILKSYKLPVEFEDERLSTKYAASLKKEFNDKKRVGDDDVAAAVILQSYFDRL